MRTIATSLVLFVAFGTLATNADKRSDTPIKYSTTANFVGPMGAVAMSMTINIASYTTPADRTTLLNTLKSNGYAQFLADFKTAAVVGYVQIKDEKFALRWAQSQRTEKGEVVTVATDQPIYFIGGGRSEAESREGYDMAIIRLNIDSIGLGTGTFAPAAHVKLTGDGSSVEVDTYGGDALTLTSVRRLFQ